VNANPGTFPLEQGTVASATLRLAKTIAPNDEVPVCADLAIRALSARFAVGAAPGEDGQAKFLRLGLQA
jgi:hypothetical protein